MTELRRLARKKGIHYKDIAEHFNCKRWMVHHSATTKKGIHDEIVEWLNTFDDVDVSIIFDGCNDLDLHYSELSRMCGLQQDRISKILNDKYPFYRWIQDRVKEVADEV